MIASTYTYYNLRGLRYEIRKWTINNVLSYSVVCISRHDTTQDLWEIHTAATAYASGGGFAGLTLEEFLDKTLKED